MNDQPPTNKWGGTYRVKFGLLTPDLFPKGFVMADNIHRQNEKKYGFYSRLEESVKREGFRNPVLFWDKPGNTGTAQVPYGGSRMYTAFKLDIPIPAIVCDWPPHNPAYDGWEDVNSVADVLEKFKDPPTVVEFRPDCFHFWGCAQVQLEDEHRDFFAQRQVNLDKRREEKPDKAAMRREGYVQVLSEGNK